MKAPFLFVESNTSGTGALFAQAAAELGYTPYLLTSDASRYAYAHRGLVTTIHVDTADRDAVWQAVGKIRQNQPIAGVLTSSEYWLATAAEMAHELALPGADADGLRKCRNKNWQRDRLEAAGLAVPCHRAVRSLIELHDAVTAIPMPLIVKPASGTGSIGVLLCRTTEEALRQGQHLLAQTVNERGMSCAPEIVVESYLNGPEFSAETFGLKVVGLTRKHLSPEPYFVEIGHDYPAAFDPEMRKEIENICLTALEILELGWGPAHIEFRLTSNGPVIIEVNPRLAGGFIPSLLRFASGIDLIRQTIVLSSGGKPDLQCTRNEAASIRFVRCTEPGLLHGIDMDGLQHAPGVVDLCAYKSGQQLMAIHNDFRDRVGHVLTVGETIAISAQNADKALGRIHVQMDTAAICEVR